SARRNASAVRATTGLGSVIVGDDVVLTIDTNAQGGTDLGAYSSYANTWSTLTAPAGTFGGSSTAGAVIAARIGNVDWAFSGRTAQWVSFAATVPGRPVNASGNTAIADLRDPIAGVGPFQVAAFSAVLGTWSVSPAYTTAVSPVLTQGRNLVAVRTPGVA